MDLALQAWRTDCWKHLKANRGFTTTANPRSLYEVLVF